jgi:S-adenosylmethionine hydrolase
VIVIDRFGNLVTNLEGAHVGAVRVGSRDLPLCRTYADVPSGEPLALIGSSGLIEIAVRDGNAAAAMRILRGAPVHALPTRSARQ